MKQSAKILGLLLILAAATTDRAHSQAILHVIGGDTVNWGKVGAGKLIRKVQLTNIGSDTLRITEVKPSCGCTTAPLDQSVLAPGDTAAMTIAMGVAGSGMETKQVAIRSNDRDNPSHTLYLEANVQQDVVAKPAAFPINRTATLDSAYRATVELVNVSNGPITISPPYKADTTTQATVKFLMTESVTLQPQEKHQLSVEITPKASGLYRVEVTVPTSGSYSQKVIIPAFFISRENTVAAKENGEVRRE